jgi:glyoxylase I family protein
VLVMQGIQEIALDMGRAEREADVASLDRYLHDDLIFRRAGGSIVDKATFLAGVVPVEQLDSDILDDTDSQAESSGSFAVTLLVRTIDGTFRNVRVFVRDLDADGRWRCKFWINTKLDTAAPLQVEMLHHVSLPVADLERSRRFYEDVLGLRASKTPRPGPPRFDFGGAWYQVGAGQLHLIVHDAGSPRPTYRLGKKLDSRDVHFALKVRSFAAALNHLRSIGYSEDNQDDFKQIKVSRNRSDEGVGFPQIYLLDPDRHTIEINAERLD